MVDLKSLGIKFNNIENESNDGVITLIVDLLLIKGMLEYSLNISISDISIWFKMQNEIWLGQGDDIPYIETIE